jgi:TonB family protein
MPIERVAPLYPTVAAEAGLEGWVLVQLRISPDGQVADLHVADSSGEQSFEHAVGRAVKQWRYAPLAEGAPEYGRCNVRVRLSLNMEARPVAPGFRKRAKAVRGALAQRDLTRAEQALAELAPRSLSEHTERFELEAEVAAVRGDLDAEAIALERVVGSISSVRGRAPSAREQAFRARRARVLAELGQHGRALDEIRVLREASGSVDGLVALEADLLARAAAGELVTSGVTRRLATWRGEPATWVAPLQRARFRVDPESGAIERAEVCCANAAFEFDVGMGEQRLPIDAKDCKLIAYGTNGSQLRLVELAPEAAPAP